MSCADCRRPQDRWGCMGEPCWLWKSTRVGCWRCFLTALPQNSEPRSCEYVNSTSLRDTDKNNNSWHPSPDLDFLKQQKERDSGFEAFLLQNVRRKYVEAFHCAIWMLSLKQKPWISGRSCWVRLQSPEGRAEHLWRFPSPKTYEFVHFRIY